MTTENKTNEVAVQEENNGAVLHEVGVAKVIEETDDYIVVQNLDGKFQRKAKFNNYSSVETKTKADKIWLMNLLDGDEESGNGLKDHVGKTIEVANIITRNYDKVDEDTGEKIYGVLTYLITPEKEVYVTSSKTVYFSINRFMELLGKPGDKEWENLQIKVGSKKGQNGTIITIKLVG